MACVQCLAIRTADPRSVCWAGGTLVGDVTLVLSDPTLVRGIRLSYKCEAWVDIFDDREEWEDDLDDGKRQGGGCFLCDGVVPPRHRTAMEKFLETTTILWGTGRWCYWLMSGRQGSLLVSLGERLRSRTIDTSAATDLSSDFSQEPTTSYGEVMPAGCHSLEFEITIPDTLPGSFEGRYGFVRHWLDCVVDRPGAAELRTSRALSVICDSDLNRHPAVMKSVRHHEHVVLCCGCFRPDQYDVSCQLPYTGYVPGETIFPDVRVRNFTRTTILLTVRLVMVTTYRAKNRVKVTKNVVVEEQKDVLRTEVTRWEPALQVPALPPTGLGGCHVIDVRYFLQVDVSSRGWGWQGVAFQDEIKIGTIPLRHVANVRHAEVRLPLQLMASHKALLVDQPALRMLAHAPVGNGSCLLSAKAPSSDGKVTSDVESGSPLAHEPPRDVMLVDPGSRTRATSIISTSSHWSFHPHTPMGVPRLHPGFLKKLAGKRNGKRGSKGFVPKLPTIYSV